MNGREYARVSAIEMNVYREMAQFQVRGEEIPELLKGRHAMMVELVTALEVPKGRKRSTED